MAIIDYADVRSLQYAKLTLSAKALIPVLATLADNVTGQLSRNDSKIQTLEIYAGLSRNSIRSGLRKLDKSKIITLKHSQGHTALIIYLPIVNLTEHSAIPGCATVAQPANQPLHSQLFEKNAVDLRYDSPKQERQLPCSLNTDLTTKTTTEVTVPEPLIKQMISTHGSSVVVSIVSAMEEIQKADPQAIQNPGAYFRSCCEKGWIPTTKIIQEKKLLQNSREKQRTAQSAADAAEAKRRQMIEAERNDPEAVKRIQAIQLSFTGIPATDHQDHNAISGHARPQKQHTGQD